MVVSGSPGVGKTALTVRAAHAASHAYPDGQLHADLRGYADDGPRRDTSHVLARFLLALGTPRERIPVARDEQVALYRTLLADRRVLVLLDNAAGPEQVRPLLPGGRSCAVLVTSRNALRGLSLDGARHLLLDALDPAESERLLTTLLGADRVHREPAAARELARLCAHIPLALRIAGANLAGYGDLTGYVAELRHGDRLSQLGVDDDPRAAVRGAFDLSYAALGDRERGVFRLLGLVPGPDATPDAVAALVGLPADEARQALARLATASLVQTPAPGRYAFHDLMREYARERARAECPPEARVAATRRLLTHYLAGADTAGALVEPVFRRMPRPPHEGGPRFVNATEAAAWLDAERANLLAAIHEIAARAPGADRPDHAPDTAPEAASGVDAGDVAFAWWLVDALRGYLARRSLVPDWLAAAEAALDAARAAGDRTAEAEMLHSIGQAWWHTGAVDRSVACLERSVAAYAEADWPAGEIAVVNNLAGSSYWQGRVERAVELFTHALRLAERHGPRQSVASVHGNLGAAYEGLDLRRAEEHLSAALDLARRRSHPGPAAAIALGNLASVRRNAGDLDAALADARAALAELEPRGEAPERLPVLNDVARIHCARRRLAEAEETARRVLARAETTGNQRVEVDALVILAAARRRARPDAAEEWLHRALATAEQAGYRNGTAEALLGLAEHALHAGEPGTARERALAARTLVGDAHRVLQAQALTALAEAERAAGDHPDATAHAEHALSLSRATGARPGEARAHRLLGELALDGGAREVAANHLDAAHRLYAAMALPEAEEVAALLRAGTAAPGR